MNQCELVRGNGTACGDTADWQVSIDHRLTDAQLSCSLHLDETCGTMYEAEQRPGAVLHVQSAPRP